MNFSIEINLEHPVPDARIASVVRDAFDLSEATVWPAAQVTDMSAPMLIQRVDDMGDFPFGLILTFKPSSGIERWTDHERIARLRRLAVGFGQIVLTDWAGTTFDDDYLLISPGGETAVVTADEAGLSAGRIELVPESRTRWNQLKASVIAVPA